MLLDCNEFPIDVSEIFVCRLLDIGWDGLRNYINHRILFDHKKKQVLYCL